jgi:hypothetical protein
VGHRAVALIGVHLAFGCVDRQLLIVGPAPIALGVGVRERPALQHLVGRELDAVDTDARTERRLLRFAKEVVGFPVEYHPADFAQRELRLGPLLGIVERVEVQFRMLAVGHDLNAELPLGEIPAVDRIVQIFGRVAEVFFLNLGGLGRGERTDALFGNPMENASPLSFTSL